MSHREVLEGQLKRQNLAPSRREKLEKELAGPQYPQSLSYLWAAYMRLRRRKAGTGMGPACIEWPDIVAFEQKSRFVLSAWEVEVLEDIDDLYLMEQAKRYQEAKKKQPKPE